MTSRMYQYANPYGDPCIIDGKDALTAFSAVMKELKYTPGNNTGEVSLAMSANHLRSSGSGRQPGTIVVTFYVSGASAQACAINTSRLIAACRECTIGTPADGFEYAAVLSAVTPNPTGVDFYNQVDLTLHAVKRLPLVHLESSHTSNPLLEFDNLGTDSSGVRLILTPTKDLPELKIQLSKQDSITVSDMTAGQTFIIDGIDGEVTCAGVNQFVRTDLIDFPKVVPGKNLVSVSQPGSVKVQVEFYPAFLD